jgi:hypothetical protein
MNKITYGIVKEIYRCGTTSRTSYGIAAYSDIETDGTSTVVAVINDISIDEQSILDLVEKCNRSNLSLCHLNEVVEDFIAYN